MSHPPPVAVLEFGPVWRLEGTQWQSLRLTVLRYFTWLDSGRVIDPWEPLPSGVARAARLDANPVKASRLEGYDAGRYAEPDADPALAAMDVQFANLDEVDRRLLRWKLGWKLRTGEDGELGGELTNDQCAERLQCSVDTVKERWRRLGVRLFYRLP